MKWLRKLLRPKVAESMAMVTGYRRPLGYQQIVSGGLGSAVGFTLPASVAGLIPGYAIVQCQGGTVRWRDDGTPPTNTVGMTIPANGELDYCGDMSAIQFISSSGTPTLDISIYA